MSGNRATVAFLLEKGFKATTESRKTWKAYPPYSSPTHYAAIVGDAQLLKMLERKGADLTAMNAVHRTPLSYAVENGNEDAVESLVKRKYPDRGGIFTSASKAPSLTYLGKGHVWGGKGSGLASVSSDRIKKALGSVGVVR
ncbi:hypothetical protein BKA61DRAFT_717107 [Leptodontidium sp. MPI-SDFR-AT-0119]|nr:hypothetical protein BKA61DRAFT_717107 [Leptodontidium sp. MPI-SDFR-AT-0119]